MLLNKLNKQMNQLNQQNQTNQSNQPNQPNQQIGKILTYKELENNTSANAQDNFTSACAYFDIKKIEKYIKNKIIPNLQHFYLLITAYVGVKQRISNAKYKIRGNIYKYFPATATGICFTNRDCIMTNDDFYFKYMVRELIDTLKIFVLNGFILDENVYKILVFLNIDLAPIDHLFVIHQSKKLQIGTLFEKHYKKYIEKTHLIKNPKKEHILSKSQSSFEKSCKHCNLEEILSTKKLNKKVMFTQNCIKSSLYNYHTEVFEFFCQQGYVPTQIDINLIPMMDRRIILLMRFYPDLFDDKNNFNDLTNRLNQIEINDFQTLNNQKKYKEPLVDIYDPIKIKNNYTSAQNLKQIIDSDSDSYSN